MTSAVRDDSGADTRCDAPGRPVQFVAPVCSSADVESLLRAALSRYRSVLEGAWTIHTAHPAYREQAVEKDPTGQCGVSSAWLVHQLHAEFGLSGAYCYGSLTIGNPIDVTIARHCWVEIPCAAEEYVIDLTADQAPGFEQRIVFGTKSQLLSDQRLHYDARVRKSRQELLGDDVWPRLATLTDSIAVRHGSSASA